jgi:hypothetical protein
MSLFDWCAEDALATLPLVPPLDTRKAQRHIAEVLIEQGYPEIDAERSAWLIALKCSMACTADL